MCDVVGVFPLPFSLCLCDGSGQALFSRRCRSSTVEPVCLVTFHDRKKYGEKTKQSQCSHGLGKEGRVLSTCRPVGVVCLIAGELSTFTGGETRRFSTSSLALPSLGASCLLDDCASFASCFDTVALHARGSLSTFGSHAPKIPIGDGSHSVYLSCSGFPAISCGVSARDCALVLLVRREVPFFLLPLARTSSGRGFRCVRWHYLVSPRSERCRPRTYLKGFRHFRSVLFSSTK